LSVEYTKTTAIDQKSRTILKDYFNGICM